MFLNAHLLDLLDLLGNILKSVDLGEGHGGAGVRGRAGLLGELQRVPPPRLPSAQGRAGRELTARCLPVSFIFYLPPYLSIYLSIYISIYLSIYLSVYLSIYLSM